MEAPRYIDKVVRFRSGTAQDEACELTVRVYSGDSTPYQFPVRLIRLLKKWPLKPPFGFNDFQRDDPTNDIKFYTVPKFNYYLDEPAIAALTQYYRNNIEQQSTILDICSSWVSHYPIEFPSTMNKIYGMGMSELELCNNSQLTGGYHVKDLNIDPTLPYEDNMFDAVTCVVSIGYLIYPIEVLKEVYRILKPGGHVIISQSNLYWPDKIIRMWIHMNDKERLELLNGYFFYAGGYNEPVEAYNITPTIPADGEMDSHLPMFVVKATKTSK